MTLSPSSFPDVPGSGKARSWGPPGLPLLSLHALLLPDTSHSVWSLVDTLKGCFPLLLPALHVSVHPSQVYSRCSGLAEEEEAALECVYTSKWDRQSTLSAQGARP